MASREQYDERGSAPSKVFLVDDHPLIRVGLRQMIDREPDLSVCGEAGNGTEAIGGISEVDPDLAIVDVSLGSESGIELIADLHTRFPDLAILALSMHEETVYAERSLKAGAKGYVMKDKPSDEIFGAIRQVLDGGVSVSNEMTSRFLRRLGGDSPGELSPLSALSNRELQIYELIGEGHGTSRIAGQLHLSVKTIETHCARIKGKLSLKSAADLRQAAIQWTRSRDTV